MFKNKKQTQKTIKETREKNGQRYSTTDLFNDLRQKHGHKGGGFFEWLKMEKEEKEKQSN